MTRLLIALLLLMAVSCSKAKQPADAVPKVPDAAQTQPGAPSVPQEPLPTGKILSPLDSIKELDRQIEAYKTGSSLTPEDVQKNQKLKQDILRGTFDIHELSRLALDTHWNGLSETERQNFANLMTSLLERKAIFSKEQVKGESKPYQVSYKDQRFIDPEKKKSQVSTVLYVPSEKVDLNINYELRQTPYGWRIYDVIVDDASLVDNYKFQFNTIITKYGYQDLINRMQKKLKEME